MGLGSTELLALNIIGVASYEALGYVPPRLPTMGLPMPRTITILVLAYSFVIVYCMNFVMFSCVTLK